MSEQGTEYIIRVHGEDDGSLWAEVLDLPGCFASGDSLNELKEALEEAISLYLADDPEAGKLGELAPAAVAHKPMQVGEMRVVVPA